jgi:KDO2-lipid IV(A) lauroyltransferase
MWSYYLYRLAGTLVPLLPPALGYRLFERIGDLAFWRARAGREAVLDNLSHVLGANSAPQQLRQAARQVFRNQAKNYADLFRLPALSDAQIKSQVTVHGLEHLDQALAAGKGAVLVSAHFGNVDVAAQAFVLLGYHLTVVAEHLKPDRLFRYICALRASKGINLVAADSFLKPVFRALARNELVALVADRDTTNSGLNINFFGAPAHLPDGYVRLALHTGAAIVPCLALRQADESYAIHIEPAIPLEKGSDRDREVRDNLQKVLPFFERYFSAYPEQWVMFQPLWQIEAQVNSN